MSLSLSFFRPSENLKPHQRWQRSRTGVLDNQTGERSRTALVSESSTATGLTLILSPISYFTIISEKQLFSISLLIIQGGTTAAAPRILGQVFARDSRASPSSGCSLFVSFNFLCVCFHICTFILTLSLITCIEGCEACAPTLTSTRSTRRRTTGRTGSWCSWGKKTSWSQNSLVFELYSM